MGRVERERDETLRLENRIRFSLVGSGRAGRVGNKLVSLRSLASLTTIYPILYLKKNKKYIIFYYRVKSAFLMEREGHLELNSDCLGNCCGRKRDFRSNDKRK